MIDLNVKISTFPVLKLMQEYLSVRRGEGMARGRLVQIKKVKFDLQEYRTSELEEIWQIINDIKASKVTVHRFGDFYLSISGFVQYVMPFLSNVRVLSLNIQQTYCKSIVYPKHLKSLTLSGFKKDHIETFLYPLLP